MTDQGKATTKSDKDDKKFFDTEIKDKDEKVVLSKEKPTIPTDSNNHPGVETKEMENNQEKLQKIIKEDPQAGLDILRKRKDGLYRAMKMPKQILEPSNLKRLANTSHEMLLWYRDKETKENVLDFAVRTNDVEKVRILVEVLKDIQKHKDIWKRLLYRRFKSKHVHGRVIKDHALTVAALNLNRQIVGYLLELGPNVYIKNHLGDNIIHSLVRYAAMVPEKILEIRDMIGFIYTFCSNSEHFEVRVLFREKNKNHLAPLQLAVLMNVSELCTYLLSIEHVYFRGGYPDSIERRKTYDITYLDSVTNRKAHMKKMDEEEQKETKEENKKENEEEDEDEDEDEEEDEEEDKKGDKEKDKEEDEEENKKGSIMWAPPSDSVIEMIFANSTHNDTALDVVNHEIIAYIIKLKWKAYKWLFVIWMLFHYAAMIILTAYSIVRIDVFFLNVSRNVPTELNGETSNDFVVISYWLTLLFGFVFTIPLALFILARTLYKPQPFKNALHNIDYFFMYLVFVICIFIDSILLGGGSRSYNGEALVLSVLFGWLFSTIFLRAIEKCGKITFLVRRFIVRDVLGFLLVFIFLLVAFATCLHDLLKYKIDENGQHVLTQNFETYGRTLFTMFHAMLGLIDIDEVFDSRSYWLAITLLILFIIITYGLLLNALIGIISSTSEEIFAHKYGYMSLNTLSVLIFMEEFFLLRHFTDPIGVEINTGGTKDKEPKNKERTGKDKEPKDKEFTRKDEEPKDRERTEKDDKERTGKDIETKRDEMEDEYWVKLEISSEAGSVTEEYKNISKEREKSQRLRNVVHDALRVNKKIIHGYKCVTCKRREMVLAANENSVDYKIRQTFNLDSEGRLIYVKQHNAD